MLILPLLRHVPRLIRDIASPLPQPCRFWTICTLVVQRSVRSNILGLTYNQLPSILAKENFTFTLHTFVFALVSSAHLVTICLASAPSLLEYCRG